MNTISEQPILKVIAQLQRKEVSAAKLPKNTRLEVVEHLTLQGYSVAEIAVLLDVADRTIVRDRAKLRQRNAVYADQHGLAGQLVGIFTQQTEAAVGRLRKMQRDKDVKPGVRVQAEHAISVIMDRFLRRLQSLGYLPNLEKQAKNRYTEPKSAQLLPVMQEIDKTLRQAAGVADDQSIHGLIDDERSFNASGFCHRAQTLARFDDGSMSRKHRRRARKLARQSSRANAKGKARAWDDIASPSETLKEQLRQVGISLDG